MKKGLLREAASPLVALLIAVGLPMHAETYYVTVNGSGFSPATLPVQVGDTVVWENSDQDDFPHTTTSTLGILDPDYWNGSMVGLGETFAHTFNNVGSFSYTDQVGSGAGTITVSPAVVPPVINLELPRIAGGEFLFEATGLTPGKTNVLLSSTDLTTWLPVSTNTAASTSVTFTNATDPGQRFYRLVELHQTISPAPTNMVWIPPGTFVMGSPTNEALRDPDEVRHPVTLTKGFYMGKYEVTQGQYLAVVSNNPSRFQISDYNGNPISLDLNRPVEQVSWNDATNYCARLTQADRLAGLIPANWRYRLPTEAEWEYACRAGTTTAFHFGSAIYGGMANFYSNYEYDAAIGDINVASPSEPMLWRTTTVGSYAPNAFGLFDMHGNVYEWCQDWYGPYPGGTVVDPAGPVFGSGRMVRGGCWIKRGRDCRSALRDFGGPITRDIRTSFRVVLAPGKP